MAGEQRRGHGRAAIGRRVAAFCLMILMPAAGAVAQPVAPTTGTAEALLAASRAAFEARAETERKQIQDDLVWASTYRGSIDGGFGRGTFTALTSFELARKLTADGILDAAETMALTKAADDARRAVDWRVLEEPASGARVGYPQKLLPMAKKSGAGALFSDAKGGLALKVERASVGPDGLAVLYAALKADQPGRRVTYAVQKPDWFVIAAEAGGRRSYSRFAATPAGPVGFTFAYDIAFADGDRLAVAIANAFAPQAEAAVAAGAPRPVTVETLKSNGQPATGVQAARAPVAVEAAKPAGPAAASALVVAPGRAVTAARVVAACPAAAIGGRPVKVVATQGAAVLVEADAATVPVTGLRLASAAGDVVALLRSAGAQPVLTAATGTALGDAAPGAPAARVLVAAPGGSAGAAVFDRGGGLVGLLGGPTTGGGAAEAALPLVPAADVAALLAGQGVTLPAGAAPTTGQTVGELARRYGAAVVAITCGP